MKDEEEKWLTDSPDVRYVENSKVTSVPVEKLSSYDSIMAEYLFIYLNWIIFP